MAKKSRKQAERKPRTDAQRNRERILGVAKEAFTRHGANASLDDIAREAGVGPGTLYRHFPSRDALIEAVYRSEVERLAEAQRKFAETMPPIEALRAWMLLFVDYIAAKHIIAPALNTIVGGAAKLYEGSRTQVQGAIDALVKRAIQSGDIRKDLEPFDLLRALIGVSNVAPPPTGSKARGGSSISSSAVHAHPNRPTSQTSDPRRLRRDTQVVLIAR
jgi:AcrR family transcriptional regulator